MITDNLDHEVAAGPVPATPNPRDAEIKRIVQSDTFSKAPRLSSLVRYICERSWNGRTDELSEQQIGIHFFHRAPGLNASEDAIVRGTARHLRKRLELHYEKEGAASAFRVSLPKGGYVAHFAPAAFVPIILHQEPEPSAPPGPQPSQRRLPLLWLSIAAAALLVAAIVGIYARQRQRAAVEALNGPLILWQTLFTANRRTLIVPGDPALNFYTAYKHREVPLIEYTEQS